MKQGAPEGPYFFDHETIFDPDAPDHALRGGAPSYTEGKGLPGLRDLLVRYLQVERRTDPGALQDAVHILDVPLYIRPVAVFRGRDL
jgi:hypothetical protein